MSTKVKEALFELIRSMSKSEKRYFKLMASRHTIGEENNYVVLFDFIDKQLVYNEEAIFLFFKGEAFLHRFSITKKRLYDHILQALDAFHSNSSVEAQLYRQLHSAQILYDKSLYDQARRILKSAEKLATKHEHFILLQKINRMMKKLVENEGYTDETSELISDIAQKDRFLQDEVQLYNVLWNIKSELFSLMNTKGAARSETDRLLYASLLNDLPTPKATSGFDQRFLYNHIQSAFFFAIQDKANCAEWLDRNLLLFQDNEPQFNANFTTYLSLLTNSIYIHESLHNRARANELLILLRALPNERGTILSEDVQVKLFASINSVELGVLIKRGDLEQAAKLVPIVEQGLRVYDGKITPTRRAFLSFKLATVFLGMKNYTEALKWVNSILNDSELDPAEDLIAFTYLIDLLIHLEMKHDNLLPYALKNTQRFLKSRGKLHGFEKVFLQFIARRIKTNNPFDAELLWEDLLQDLSELNHDGLDKIAMEYFDFRTWAEAKVNKKEFASLLKEKSLARLKTAS